MNKKGISLSQAPSVVVVLVIIGIILSVGASILVGVQGGYTSGTYAYNATEYGLRGIDKVATWQPTIGLAIGAALVIGVVLGAFAFVRKGE